MRWQTRIPFWTLVVHGIDQERFKTMGQGSKRSAGDILGIMGQKNTRNLAAALRWVWRYDHGQMMNPHPPITDDELADTIQDHQEIVQSLAYSTQMKPHGMIAPGLVTAMHYLCARSNKAEAATFFHRFANGQELDEGNPILVLRHTLVERSKGGKARRVLRDEHKAPMLILTWNLLRQNPQVRIKNSQRITWRQGRTGRSYPAIL